MYVGLKLFFSLLLTQAEFRIILFLFGRTRSTERHRSARFDAAKTTQTYLTDAEQSCSIHNVSHGYNSNVSHDSNVSHWSEFVRLRSAVFEYLRHTLFAQTLSVFSNVFFSQQRQHFLNPAVFSQQFRVIQFITLYQLLKGDLWLTIGIFNMEHQGGHETFTYSSLKVCFTIC